MKILTSAGRKAFTEFVDRIRSEPTLEPPVGIFADPDYSFNLQLDVELPEVVGKNKYELGSSLLPVIEAAEEFGLEDEHYPGFWDSLSLHCFSLICPRTAGGKWKPRNAEHYCFTEDYKVRHRHRIYGPVTLVRYGGSSISGFLQKEPSVLGDFEEQIGSRQEIVGNPAALEALGVLYTSSYGSGTKHGFSSVRTYPKRSKKLPGPGTLRRFVIIHQQLSRNFDLMGLSSSAFLELLPAEFARWKNGS